jgi:HK97 family phage major capsid protein
LYVELSNSLAADGLSFGQQLADAMRKSASWQLDHAFLRGSGVGQPTGILTSGARVTVAKESGQQADTIVYANVTTMLSRLHPASFRSAVWVAHPSTLPQLLALSVPVGTGGSHVPAVLQADGGFTLLTRPLLFSEKASTLGDEGDLMLADFRAYQIGLRADVTLDVSGHVGFRSNKTAFRLTLRIDGQPGIRTPYTLPSGMTSSPFVTLAAR